MPVSEEEKCAIELDLEEAAPFKTLRTIAANESATSTNRQHRTFHPMEPLRTLPQPGAYRVVGPDHEDSGLSTLVSYGVPEDDTAYDDPADPKVADPEVAAHLVDTQEEERRIQELEAQNKMLREREQSTVEAQVMNKSEILKSFFNLRDPEFQRQRLCSFGFIFLALSAIVIGVVLTKDKRRSPIGALALAPTVPPTPEPTSEGHGDLTLFLSEFASFDGGASITNQSTPQYQASKWLADNNTRLDEYSDKQKIQRYALATLFFSTNGDNWTDNTKWLDDGDECGKWFQSIWIGSFLYSPK